MTGVLIPKVICFAALMKQKLFKMGIKYTISQMSQTLSLSGLIWLELTTLFLELLFSLETRITNANREFTTSLAASIGTTRRRTARDYLWKVKLKMTSSAKTLDRISEAQMRRYLPVHFLPSPWYPLRQRHTYDPSVLVQRALGSHSFVSSLAHSSLSGKE